MNVLKICVIIKHNSDTPECFLVDFFHSGGPKWDIMGPKWDLWRGGMKYLHALTRQNSIDLLFLIYF